MRTLARLLPVFAACAALSSCQNSGGSSEGPYVSNFGSDGGYHPYPNQPGTMQSSGGSYVPPPATAAPPTYTAPPAPQNDPYAFSAPSSSSPAPHSSAAPKKSTASSTKSAGSSSKSTASSRPKSSTKKSSGSYKVVKGDTLYGIARKRGSSVAKIKAANGLSSDLIRPGQVLKVP